MYWVLQNNLFNEEQFNRLVSALESGRVPYSIHKVIPFAHDLMPEIDPPQPVVVMGATTLADIAVKRGWSPGSFLNENFDFEVQRQHWGSVMLNADAQVHEFASIPEQETFFVRPVHDTKSLSGIVLSWDEYVDWRHRLVVLKEDPGLTLRPETKVVVASPKKIYQEWRLWLVEGRVITGSLYKVNDYVRAVADLPDGVVEFATAQAARWVPARAFVMDVASTPDGLRIIEINNINSAGFYAADVSKIVQAIDGLA